MPSTKLHAHEPWNSSKSSGSGNGCQSHAPRNDTELTDPLHLPSWVYRNQTSDLRLLAAKPMVAGIPQEARGTVHDCCLQLSFIKSKTTLICHLTPVRMAVARETNKKKYASSNMDKGNPYVLLKQHKLVQPPWKSVRRLLN